MCTTTEKALVPALAKEVIDTERPMRWREAELLAKRFSKEVMEAWQDFTARLLGLLPDPQSLQSVGATKSFSLATTEKRYSAAEIDALGIRLIQLGVPRDTVERIEALFDEVMDEMMVQSQIAEPGVFNRMYEDVYKEGLNHAEAEVIGAIDAAPRRLREWLRQNISPVPIFSAQSQMYKAMTERGFELVKAKITQEFKGLAFDAIAFGLEEGQGWQEIARSINRQAGTGAGWHWKRLVRTEMTGAFDTASRERYAQMQVRYVKFSPTAGACEICMALVGTWQFGTQPELPWNTHPNCFIDGQVPIYTSKGWVPIKEIKEGDLVLTHQGRFKKVLRTLKDARAEAGEMVYKFKYRYSDRGTEYTSSVTGEHPILTNRGWVMAKDMQVGDRIFNIATKCLDCGEKVGQKIDSKAMRCRPCAAKLNSSQTIEQWKNEEHRNRVSRANSEANLRQYASGQRDRFKAPLKAQEASRQLAKMGKHALQNPENKKKSMRALAAGHNGSRIEKMMEQILKGMGLQYEHQHWVEKGVDSLGKKRYYFPDFWIKGTEILIECDGEKWHNPADPKEMERQAYLESVGYKVLRFWGREIKNNPQEVADTIRRVYMNDTHQYEFVESEVIEVKAWPLKKARKLFNFAVEEDESYVANGVVMHNCRCRWVPVFNLPRGVTARVS